MSGAAGRRDNPAARAALARRRQRAAQNIQSSSSSSANAAAAATANTSGSLAQPKVNTTAATARGRTSTAPAPAAASGVAQEQPTQSRRPTTTTTKKLTQPAVSKEAPPQQPQPQQQSSSSPLAQYTTTAKTTARSAPPTSAHQALAQSEQAAAQATRVLHGVTDRQAKKDMLYSSKSNITSTTKKSSSPAAAARQPPRPPPSPKQLLAASPQQRRKLRSRSPSPNRGRRLLQSGSVSLTSSTTSSMVGSSRRKVGIAGSTAASKATSTSQRRLQQHSSQLSSRGQSSSIVKSGTAAASSGTTTSQQQPQPTSLQRRAMQQGARRSPSPTPPQQQYQQQQQMRTKTTPQTPVDSSRTLQRQQYYMEEEQQPLEVSIYQDASTLMDMTLHHATTPTTSQQGRGPAFQHYHPNEDALVSPSQPLFGYEASSPSAMTPPHPSATTSRQPFSYQSQTTPSQSQPQSQSQSQRYQNEQLQYFEPDSTTSTAPQSQPTTAAADNTTTSSSWNPSFSSILDASVLQSGTQISLRSFHQPLSVVVMHHHEQKDAAGTPPYPLAALEGPGLGRPMETLTLQKVPTAAAEDDSMVVRHGDTILLYSAMADDCALGSRKFVQSSTGTSKVELGFFGPGSKAELWTILPARPDQEVIVGRAALEVEQSQPSPMMESLGVPIRSGDPILLRNMYNGGILSLNRDGQLVLLTDSYHHDENPSSLRQQQQQQQYQPQEDLMGRLQHHDRLFPTPLDTFQMILAVTPPCPPWIASHGSCAERIFWTGSYLVQDGRNQPNVALESTLFAGSTGGGPSILQGRRRPYPAADENLSPKTKEQILMDEVIGSFLGLEGVHVRLLQPLKEEDRFEFRLIDGDGVTFDAGLRHLVDQILPLSTSFVRVRNFVALRHPGYEHGRVMQAFCEALDALLQDYVQFVSQLEWELRKSSKTGSDATSLTMKSMYFQVTPSIHSMSILEHATKAVSNFKGGELINALWSLDKQNYMGDKVAKRVLGILLEKASGPYMEILSEWLQTGKLKDPYEEFMVQKCASDGRTIFDGDSWFALYQISTHHVLQGVAPNNWTKDKILTTGKYWNAVQECHLDCKDIERPTKNSKIPDLPFNSDSSAIAAYIDSKYQTASKVLVRVLMDNFKLMESLQIMKRYFLIDQGDFLMHFLDAAEQELLKPHDEISMGRLQHWLNMSVQLTEAHKEEWDPVSGLRISSSSCPLIPAGLRCRLSEKTLVAHLDSLYGGGIADHGPITPSRRAYGMSTHVTGIEVFTIDFPRVPFPISLLMSQKAMDDYKLLFRHLFFTKHVERRLIAVWKDNQLLKKLGTLRGPLGPTYLLRQRMLHFVQNLIYFMVFEVVEGNWMEMRNVFDDRSNGGSDKPQTVDDILEIHQNFLERTLEACLLTNSDLVRSLTKLMNTCLLFTDQMKRFMDTTKIYNDSLNLAAEKRGVVQRNLNERGPSQGQQDKRAVRKALNATKEERQTIQNRQSRRVGREVNSDSYKRMVQRFDEVFSQDLANFMKQLNIHTTSGIVSNLGIRLDYNGYVTGAMASNNSK